MGSEQTTSAGRAPLPCGQPGCLGCQGDHDEDGAGVPCDARRRPRPRRGPGRRYAPAKADAPPPIPRNCSREGFYRSRWEATLREAGIEPVRIALVPPPPAPRGAAGVATPSPRCGAGGVVADRQCVLPPGHYRANWEPGGGSPHRDASGYRWQGTENDRPMRLDDDDEGSDTR